ncbi:MAG: M14 family zinc carboxypeptidase [Flavobacteriia bacterium]|jgi:PKD repeat protein
MNRFFALFIALISGLFAYSQEYSRVKIYTGSEGLKQLGDAGVAVDHGIYKQESFFISDFSAAEIQTMQQMGFNYEVLIADVQQYYVDHANDPSPSEKNATCSGTGGGGTAGFTPSTPTNFNLGSMGGYLTYQQMLNELDAMVAQYPTLITAKAQISTFLTHGNRPIYFVKISDSPATNDATEPKVLYTAIHHAREPMSLMETIFYMWYLLENYGTNDEVTYLVNNMQMYFVPCINPDGYLYNEQTNPNGGGMWRKNRRNNGGSYGVDLNRNYSYGWGTTGTSTNPGNDTYCGPSAFSEPETQAIRWLVQNNNFITAFNAHTYAEEILFPIGTTTAEFADHHDYFQAETNHMVQYNGYGAIKSSALYPASGDSDDYMYKVDCGVNQKDTVFAHTPEVGTAFWQPSSQIISTCAEMVFPNLVLAHLTRKYVIVSDTDPTNVATMTGNFNHSAYRLGRENGPVTVSIQPLLNIAAVGSPVIHDLDLMQTATGAISYSLVPGIQFGDEIKYILITNNGLWSKKDTITKTYGVLTLQALEDASTTTNWTGNWSTTTLTFVSATRSFTESPGGNYSNNTSNKTYTYVPSIDLTNATGAQISYYAKWNIEADYDYVQFQVSTDGGANWIGQCTNYTVPGTSANNSVQPNNEPVYEGVQSGWVLDEINLSDYLGQVIKVRFIFESDGGQTGDGFYFDDFKVMYNLQGPAAAPTASFTAATTTVCTGESVVFNDFSSDSPTSWSWSFGDGATSIFQSPSHIYTSPGTYTVELTVSNAAGTDTYTMPDYITVNQTPSVTMTTTDSDNIVCEQAGLVNLSSTPAGAIFSGTGVNGSQFDPSVAGTGPHLITATYTDGNGCEGTTQVTLFVESCLSLDQLLYNGISLQPNPNNGEFNVSGLELGSTLEVTDLNGKRIYSAKVESTDQLIKLKNTETGFYYLKTIKKGVPIQIKIAVL